MSKTQTAKKLDRCRRQIDNLLRQGEEEIYNSIYNKGKDFRKTSKKFPKNFSKTS